MPQKYYTTPSQSPKHLRWVRHGRDTFFLVTAMVPISDHLEWKLKGSFMTFRHSQAGFYQRPWYQPMTGCGKERSKHARKKGNCSRLHCVTPPTWWSLFTASNNTEDKTSKVTGDKWTGIEMSFSHRGCSAEQQALVADLLLVTITDF